MSYDKRGVSSQKEDVHNAIKHLDKGLYPNAFCKVLPDILAGDKSYCNIMHADTAGTKTSLAYLYWKETGDLSVWKGIAQDAIVMNTDDMACAGVTNQIILSSTIGRNKHLIPGEVISEIINGTTDFIESMAKLGIDLYLSGGETADVGDIVRTADVGFTAFARIKRESVKEIDIKEDAVIVGFASYGMASYETQYNSGIGCNGLTMARHELFSKVYRDKYPETYSPETDRNFIYSGKYLLNDIEPITNLPIGKLALSPTRTFLPLIDRILKEHSQHIQGIIHNTGGGYTKSGKFIKGIKIVKDNLLSVPPIFNVIQEVTGLDWKEMLQVFNCGCRLEVYTNRTIAEELIAMGKGLNIEAQIIGYTKKSDSNEVELVKEGNLYSFVF